MQTRIMVVDDEAVTGRLLVYQLQALGYSVTYLQDGLQALQRVLIEQPDLILLDVVMPHVSGWEVCREIRSCSTVPIIMVTGKDADDDVAAGLAAGADDYVTKPFNMTQLHARIEAVLRRSAQSRPLPYVTPAPASVRPTAPAPRREIIAPVSRTTRPAVAQIVTPAVMVATPAAAPIETTYQPAPAEPVAPRIVEEPRLGPRLYATRLARGLSLYQAERLCHVRWDYLQAIEQENWDYMPRPQIREAIQAYTRLLRIEVSEPAGRIAALRPEHYHMLLAVLSTLLVVILVTVILTVAVR